MFSVKFRNGTELTCHVGRRLARETLESQGLYPETVESLQADGHELEWIRSRITYIPMHPGRVVEWYGDDAKFIFRAMVCSLS